MSLQPHQQRVIEESNELTSKLLALEAFFGTALFKSLPMEENMRLLRQADAMWEYSNVLNERIAAFK